MTWGLVGAALALALANGANDNFKGVATIYGSATASYRWSLAWATITSLAGAALALLLAGGLVEVFSGAGLVPDATTESTRFLVAVGVGAGLTVALASVFGLPISTTHALVGGLVGAGISAVGHGLDAGRLGGAFLLPLVAGPALAIAVAGALYATLRFAAQRLGVRRESCVCVGGEWVPVAPALSTVAGKLPVGLVERRELTIGTGTASGCLDRHNGGLLGISAQRVLDLTHVLAAGAVGFARGVNDTPKIAALLIASQAVGATTSVWAVGAVMAAGGILGARQVAETMSHRVTSMTPGQGLVANLGAAFLVIVASRYSLPVSTTHVTNGGLFAVGAVTGQAHWPTIRAILLAWVTTLPVAAALGALGYLALGG